MNIKKNKPAISEEMEAALRRLADSHDFKTQFAEPWKELAEGALKEALKESRKSASERNAQAVVDSLREYDFYTLQHNSVYGTLAELAALRAAKAAAITAKEEPQKQGLPNLEEHS